MEKKEFDVLRTLWHNGGIHEEITGYVYKGDGYSSFFSNREDYFLKNSNGTEIEFLYTQLEYLAELNKVLRTARNAILDNIEEWYPDEFDSEWDIWAKYEEQMLLNEDYVKSKMALEKQLSPQTTKPPKGSNTDFVSFEQLFKDPKNANPSLDKLKEVFPRLLSDDYTYIKGVKGIFPMFIDCLRQLDYIKSYSDLVYKDALNAKIKKLNLSKDASEFRKTYTSLTDDKHTDLKLSLSQISH